MKKKALWLTLWSIVFLISWLESVFGDHNGDSVIGLGPLFPWFLGILILLTISSITFWLSKRNEYSTSELVHKSYLNLALLLWLTSALVWRGWFLFIAGIPLFFIFYAFIIDREDFRSWLDK